ncbi:MAG: Smr/MutS family protein [Gammaproteobacteria bacterium]
MTRRTIWQMSENNDHTEDHELFRQAMDDVRPIKQDEHIVHETRRPAPHPRQQELDDQQVLQDMMSDPYDLTEVETGEELSFCRAGVQHKTFRKLRRGEFALEAELDLHGKTVDEARMAITGFLPKCQQQGLRCIRIIHGKGHGSFNKQPVLKTYVNHWLRQRDEVLAFCSARPADGGTGAIYLLLKK